MEFQEPYRGGIMRKLFTAALLLLAMACTASAGVYSKSKLFDLTAADTLDVYFSGSDYLPIPGSTASGWSVWLHNGVTMDCSDIDVIVWPMLHDGQVSTNSANATTLWTALDVSDSTTVEHTAIGTIDKCFGLKIIVVPTSGTGTMRLELIYSTD
jgi:hypothetical protein